MDAARSTSCSRSVIVRDLLVGPVPGPQSLHIRALRLRVCSQRDDDSEQTGPRSQSAGPRAPAARAPTAGRQDRDGADMRTAALTPRLRDDALAALRATTEGGPELDVLVIGGGVTGAGIALDAVTRGLSTAVIDAQDWASGTSSRSSKLVHGGLRYLQMLDFHLVREALTERDL